MTDSAARNLPSEGSPPPRGALGLLDSTCLIVGIIIGVGVYQMAPDIARGAGGAWATLGLWALGGVLSLCGALGYAELATAYPRQGGDYVYLTRAYGPWAGFLFGWAQLSVVRPGDIAVLAFAFATYAQALWDPLAGHAPALTGRLYAVGAVVLLTLLNVLGIRAGKGAQNLLTAAKVAGLLTVVVAALVVRPAPAAAAAPAGWPPPALALIFVLFAYGGWNEMAYVAAEVRNPRRTIIRALVAGMVAVTVLYLLINGAFLRALGHAGLSASKAAAADAVAQAFPRAGGAFIAALICVSALGAVNGLILTGARISYALGRDHRMFGFLGRWNAARGTPVPALLLQGGLAALLVLILGTFVNAVLYTAAVVYLFYLATTVAVIVLRRREPEIERPFRVPGYPVPLLLFAAVCVVLIRAAVMYKPWIAGAAGALLLAGLPLYWFGGGRPPPVPPADRQANQEDRRSTTDEHG